MGGGIAQVVAASGRRVSLHDELPGAVDRALASDGEEPREARGEGRRRHPRRCSPRVSPVDDIVPADLLIEAVVEDAAVKRGDLPSRRRDPPPEAILASNTSSIPITSLAAATESSGEGHRDALLQSGARAEARRGHPRAADLGRDGGGDRRARQDLGKTPAEANDFPGFVSNRILMPFVNEAAYALMEGVAEAEAIDTIAKLGFAHPMGPLALADLIGLDTCVSIMEVLHEGSAIRSTLPARCCASTSRPGASAGSPAGASTITTYSQADGLRADARPAGDPDALLASSPRRRSSRTPASGIASTASPTSSTRSSPSSG